MNRFDNIISGMPFFSERRRTAYTLGISYRNIPFVVSRYCDGPRDPVGRGLTDEVSNYAGTYRLITTGILLKGIPVSTTGMLSIIELATVVGFCNNSNEQIKMKE